MQHKKGNEKGEKKNIFDPPCFYECFPNLKEKQKQSFALHQGTVKQTVKDYIGLSQHPLTPFHAA